MLCTPPDTIVRLKSTGREEGVGEVRKGRTEADVWGGHGGNHFPKKWEQIYNDIG